MNIEAKLGLDVFKIDTEQPHIIINQEVCQAECQTRYCLYICPAKLYMSVMPAPATAVLRSLLCVARKYAS